MARAFVILTQNASAENQIAIGTLFPASDSSAWWHWFSQAWLVVDFREQWTATSIRDKITAICPELTHFVFEMEYGANYAGFAPHSWHEWFDSVWPAAPKG